MMVPYFMKTAIAKRAAERRANDIS